MSMKVSKEFHAHLKNISSSGGSASWKGKTSQDKSAEMSRRRKLGIENKRNRILQERGGEDK